MRYGLFNPNSHTVVDTYNAVSSGGEGGSNAMSGTGPKIRNVAALARQALLGMAATQLGVPAAQLTVDKGVVSGGGKTVTYGSLVGGKLFKISGANVALQPGVAPSKPFSAYKTVLKDPNPVTRIDIPDKVTGKYTYVHQVRVPGMMHARMVRPRGQGAVPVQLERPGQRRRVVDRAHPGRSGRARQQLPRRRGAEGVRRDPGGGSAEGRLEHEPDPARAPATSGSTTATSTRRGRSRPRSTPRRRATWTRRSPRRRTRVSGTFKHHYQGHMPIGPSCAVADVRGELGDDLEQHPERLQPRHRPRRTCSRRSRRSNIRVLFYEGSGSFGNGCVAFDTAESAAIMSKAIGKPVRLQMMRWDEHGWTHYAPGDHVRHAGRRRLRPATSSPYDGHRLRPGRHVALHRARARRPDRRYHADRERAPDVDRRRRRGDGEPVAVDEGVEHELPCDQQADPDRRTASSTAARCAPRALSRRRWPTPRSSTCWRSPANMDSLQFRLQNMNTDLDGQRWAGGAPGGGPGGRLEAVGRRLRTSPRTTSARAAASPTATTAAPTRPRSPTSR